MAIVFVAQISIKDQASFMGYAEQALPLMLAEGAEPLVRAAKVQDLKGETSNTMIGVFRFPTMEAMERWYNSDAYAALHQMRDQGADVVFTVYDEV